MKRIIFTCCYLLLYCVCFSQKEKTYTINTIAFYNLENLLDTIDDPNKKDEYSPILQIKSSKSEAYWNKIGNIARVLSEIGKEKTKSSPSIIGICEIENSAIIDDLLNTLYFKNQHYNYVHQDSPDWRGIDVALIYKETAFGVSDYKSYELKAWNNEGYRVRTRNQLLVSGYLDGELIHIIVNHWPSQRSGAKKTTYLRKKSAELNKTIISEIQQNDANAKIITLGDFNDNPNSISIKKGLETASEKEKLTLNNLYNPFENMFKKGFGTLGFRDNINLFDQIIFTPSLTTNNYSSYQFYKAGIFNPNYLITKSGRYKGYPYRSFSNGKFTGGFSDHYPVYIYLIKRK